MKSLSEFDVIKGKLESLLQNDLGLEKKNMALYGTGFGAEIIYKALTGLSLENNLVLVFENDSSPTIGETFHKIPIKVLSDEISQIGVILIGARKNHLIVKNRVEAYIKKCNAQNKIDVIDLYGYNTDQDIREYVEFLEKKTLRKSERFVVYKKDLYKRKDDDTKIIAWYLPQFHQMESNNKYHGRGFTEWTNSSNTLPQFTDHYQPHIPYDVGYYDLTNLQTLRRQVELANHYGIYGFCIHYYWFDGAKEMTEPIELLLRHPELDTHFCLSWATEDWTTRWTGEHDEVIHSIGNNPDSDRFARDIKKYFDDERYLRIDNKPVLVIYRNDVFDKDVFVRFIGGLRTSAKDLGFSDIYIIISSGVSFNQNVADWGGDALVEYNPWALMISEESREYFHDIRPSGYCNPFFRGWIKDIEGLLSDKKYMIMHESKKYYRSAVMSWDNTARKALGDAGVILGITPDSFRDWVRDIIDESKRIHDIEEDYVFINSWNEWAEGNYMEPDLQWGKAYLNALHDELFD